MSDLSALSPHVSISDIYHIFEYLIAIMKLAEGLLNPNVATQVFIIFLGAILLISGLKTLIFGRKKEPVESIDTSEQDFEISYVSTITEEPPSPVYGNADDVLRLTKLITTYYPGGWLRIIDNNDTILELKLSENYQTQATIELSGPEISKIYGPDKYWIATQTLSPSEALSIMKKLDHSIIDIYRHLDYQGQTWNAEIIPI